MLRLPEKLSMFLHTVLYRDAEEDVCWLSCWLLLLPAGVRSQLVLLLLLVLGHGLLFYGGRLLVILVVVIILIVIILLLVLVLILILSLLGLGLLLQQQQQQSRRDREGTPKSAPPASVNSACCS